MNDLSKRSKYLSLLLRHQPELANLTVDQNGWVMVSQLLKNTNFTLSELKEIVKTDNKNRYSFNNNCYDKIRANQGHSFQCNPDLKETIPPSILYHGTGNKSIDLIYKSGIQKMSRMYVHLSQDIETALRVGSRHGTPVIFVINAEQMYKDGYKFYLSANNVWLTDFVDVKYFIKLLRDTNI